jgi:hypothetical protein
MDQISEAIKSHNEKFHSEAPYQSNVWWVVNGAKSGQLVWSMGPCTFTSLDNRPSGEGHDKDWMNNVLSHCVDAGNVEYWKMNPKLSHFPASFDLKKLVIWCYDIKSGKYSRFRELMGKITEVHKAHFADDPMGVYFNQFSDIQAGRDAVVVWFIEKWAEWDEDSNFSEKYEMVHGKGTWASFLNDWRDTVKGRVDEVRELIPELSTRPATITNYASQNE